MPSTLVAVVDDHEVVREGIRLVSMTSQADVKLVGSASTVPGLIDQLGRDPENAALT
ncbi:MAG: DNA-binding response regulator, partial [Kocuria palustris]